MSLDLGQSTFSNLHRYLAVLTWLAAVSLMTITQDKKDQHSYAEPDKIVVQHVDLDLTVDFEKKQLRGHATLKLLKRDELAPLVLDTRRLDIERCEGSRDGVTFEAVKHELGKEDPI